MGKAGLEYFSFDIDFFNDDKILFVAHKHGAIGELIAIKLLCKIYRNGYFIQWDPDATDLLTASLKDDTGAPFTDKQKVINSLLALINRSFFDRGLFEKYGIFTSRGIQQRYFEAAARRKNVEVIEDFLLIDLPGHEENYCFIDNYVYIVQHDVYTMFASCTTEPHTMLLKESKVKESKVKESTVKKTARRVRSDTPDKIPYAEKVLLSEDQYDKLIDKFGLDDTLQMIDILNNYKLSSGKTYASDYNAILNWVVERINKGKPAAKKEDVFLRLKNMATEGTN
jgi:hypothetical protein